MTLETPRVADERFTRWRGRIDLFTIVAAAIATFAPTADEWLRDDESRGPHREQRPIAPKPATPRSFAELRAWPSAWQTWWNDRFGLRDQLLRGNGVLKVVGFSVGPGKDHVVGKDGWLYWRGAGVLESWRGADPMDESTLAAWRTRLQSRRDRCAALGAHYLFVLVPEKVTAYPEHLPDRYRKIGPSRADRLFEALADSGIDAFDLRPTIAAAKRLDRPGNAAYFEHGTHWRHWCAALATADVLEHLRSRFPSLPTLPLDRFVPVPSEGLGDSEARAMYVDDFFRQEEHAIEPAAPRATTVRLGGFPRLRSTMIANEPDLPCAIVFHDSFGIYLEKPLAESFSSLTMVWSYAFDEALVEKERPDVVIEWFAERVLQTLDPTDGPRSRDLAAEFAAAAPRFSLDPRDASRWTPMYRASLVAGGVADDPWLQFDGHGPPDCVVLPEFALGGARLLVRYDVTAPAATTLEVFYKRAGDTNYSPANRIERPLTAGRNEGFLEIEVDSLVDRLILSPGRARGRYQVRVFEIRAEEAPR